MTCDVLVVGSGIAGSAAARALALRGHDVVLVEKRRLPAHKLCGEFWSPEVQDSLERLGLLQRVLESGAVPIRRARLTSSSGAVFEHALPGTAIGISRHVMDRLLLEAARDAGARVLEETGVTGVSGSLAEGFQVEIPDGAVRARIVVGAWGRRDRLDRRLRAHELTNASPWVAFKAHFEGSRLPGLIELHTFPGGYCGMSEVEGGRVNVCWITHRDRLRDAGGSADAMISGIMSSNSALKARFAGLKRVSERFLSASQLRFSARSAFAGNIPLVGDAAGMIAPLCGDGMAMALDGAHLLSGFSGELLTGQLSPTSFVQRYDQAWKQAFGSRLTLGRTLHRALTHDRLASAALGIAHRFPSLGAWAMRATRG